MTARRGSACLAALLGALLGPGGSAEDVDELPRQTIQGNAACIRVDRVQDFTVIDSRTVIVWRSNRRDPHQISLFHGCPRLRGANAIYFDTDGWDRVCGRGGEYLVVTRPHIPSIRGRVFPQRRRSFPRAEQELVEERCAVASVQSINDDVVHELLVQGGHAAPRGPERPDDFEVVQVEPPAPSDK